MIRNLALFALPAVVMMAHPIAVAAQSSGADAPMSGETLRSWFSGRWTDDGNCSNAITMHENGRFTNADGTGGNWVLNGTKLTMSGGNGSIVLQLVPDGEDALSLVYADGTTGYSHRCR